MGVSILVNVVKIPENGYTLKRIIQPTYCRNSTLHYQSKIRSGRFSVPENCQPVNDDDEYKHDGKMTGEVAKPGTLQ